LFESPTLTVTRIIPGPLQPAESALRRSRRAAAADFFVAPPQPIFGHRRAAAAAADNFLVGAPPMQYIEVSIFSWTVL